MHACEPGIDELRKIQKELFTQESTDDNMRKIKAVTLQLERRIVEEKEGAKQV